MKEQILKYLNDEKRDIKTRRKGLDLFFEELEKNPMYLMPDGSSKADFFAEDCRLRKAACMRKVTVFESQLRELYSQFSGLSFAMMEDSVYTDLSEKTLGHISNAIDALEEMVEYYMDEISILDCDILDCEKELF